MIKMDMDSNKPHCPILDVDGVISGGKQFDLDIILQEDNRDVIYGVVKNCFKEPVSNAVVKLVEVVYDCGKEDRRPIGHTFTDKDGEFVLDLFALVENMLFKFGLMILKKLRFVQNVSMKENV